MQVVRLWLVLLMFCLLFWAGVGWWEALSLVVSNILVHSTCSRILGLEKPSPRTSRSFYTNTSSKASLVTMVEYNRTSNELNTRTKRHAKKKPRTWSAPSCSSKKRGFFPTFMEAAPEATIFSKDFFTSETSALSAYLWSIAETSACWASAVAEKNPQPPTTFWVFVGSCWFLLVFVGFCWFLLVLVGFCWFLLVLVGFCWFLLVFVGFCWFLLVFVGFCWFLLLLEV